jgi:hypothetical protein
MDLDEPLTPLDKVAVSLGKLEHQWSVHNRYFLQLRGSGKNRDAAFSRASGWTYCPARTNGLVDRHGSAAWHERDRPNLAG